MTNQLLDVLVRSHHSLSSPLLRDDVRDARIESSLEDCPVPAILCRLHDLRYVQTNQAFRDLTDSRDEDWLGRSAYQCDLLGDAAQHEIAKRHLIEGRTISPMGAMLAVPHGESRPVVIAGQPVMLADIPHMLFTITDDTPLQATVRQHEQITAAFFRLFDEALAPIMLVSAATMVIHRANPQFCKVFGYRREDIVGRTLDEIAFAVLDEDSDRSVVTSGVDVHDVASTARIGDRDVVDCRVSRITVTIADRDYHLWTLLDVTQRRLSERNLTEAIGAVVSESNWLSQSIMENIARNRASTPNHGAQGLKDLTIRERDVLALICQGLDDKTIARTLNVAGNTVRNHVARIYCKIGVNRRVAAAAWARERGFGYESSYGMAV